VGDQRQDRLVSLPSLVEAAEADSDVCRLLHRYNNRLEDNRGRHAAALPHEQGVELPANVRRSIGE
jgi:hypothetical protein